VRYDCIESGFYSSVMIDASHEPFEENVTIWGQPFNYDFCSVERY
jgi:fructose/tagatose bisphosphate aldolase